MSSIVEVYMVLVLVVEKKKTLTMHMRRLSVKAGVIKQEAAGQSFK